MHQQSRILWLKSVKEIKNFISNLLLILRTVHKRINEPKFALQTDILVTLDSTEYSNTDR